MIRVLIADDNHLMREGFRALLRRAPDIEVVGEARDGHEAVEMAVQLLPDVITMDIKMPHLDGLRATQQIRAGCAPCRIIMVAMAWDKSLVQQALNSGATGYVAKAEAFEEVIPAIRAVYAGDTYFSQTITWLPHASNPSGAADAS